MGWPSMHPCARNYKQHEYCVSRRGVLQALLPLRVVKMAMFVLLKKPILKRSHQGTQCERNGRLRTGHPSPFIVVSSTGHLVASARAALSWLFCCCKTQIRRS